MSVASVAHELAREGFRPVFGQAPAAAPSRPAWARLVRTGTAIWLDTGDLAEAAALWDASFSALTTNNTLLNREIQKGLYDGLVARLAAALRDADPRLPEEDLVLEVAFVLNAYHGLRLVERFDARVSVELHTALADDVPRTVLYGRRFHAVCPERFVVKVPFTPAGLLGARRLARDGIPVNLTLGFSARQNHLAARLARPAWVNVFVGRLNAFVADHRLGDGANVGEKAALAGQRDLAELRRAGRTESLLIGASIRSGEQVAALAGLDVLTIPPAAAARYAEAAPADLASRAGVDPAVAFAPGVRASDFYGDSLWEIPDDFREAVSMLLAGDVETLTPAILQRRFEEEGFGEFLPRWTDEEIRRATADGKIPAYAKWKRQLASREIGLDALMNLCALRSFAQDQAALDARIRSLLPKH